MQALTLKQYLETVDLRSLLARLGAQDIELVIEAIKHFTDKEAAKRDKIVLDYFGEHGVKQITETIVTSLTLQPKLRKRAQILDMGAGSGFFTKKIAEQLAEQLPRVSFYAMDATPAMVLTMEKKAEGIIPFFGIAENIAGSLREARKYAGLPERFDAAFSTLMLHHCPDIDKVFQSIRQILSSSGKAVIVDLCKHPFTEFREEMGDLHLGFDPEQIREKAKILFSEVSVKKLPGICCASSGRRTELFIATMKP